MYFETNSDIALDGEEVVNVDDVVLASGEEETVVRGEADCCYVG